MRRILKTKRIGHTGTLDPFATGVLVMLVGKATRLAQFLDKAPKEYEAIVRFGFETETGDRTGELRITRCFRRRGRKCLGEFSRRNRANAADVLGEKNCR
jgi:tRNA pseudouridine(55) synthase